MQVRYQYRYLNVQRWTAMAVVIALVLAGCDTKPDPPETKNPRLTYGQASPDMCDQVKATEVAAKFGLKLRSGYDPTVGFDPEGSHVYLSCAIRAYDDSARFRTKLGDFGPAGTISLRIYPNHEDAKDAHEADASSLRKFVESKPEVSTQNVSGWWDEGLYVRTVAPIDPKKYPRIKDLDAAGVEVLYELHHANLLVTTRIDTVAPTPQKEEVLAFLRDFADAFTKEAVSHLSRTGPK